MNAKCPRTIGVVVVLIVGLATSSPAADKSLEQRVRATKDQLRVALVGGAKLSDVDTKFWREAKTRTEQDPNVTPAKRNFNKGFLHGFAQLLARDPSYFAHPRLLAVNIVESDFDGKPCIELIAFWLSSENVTEKVFVQDSKGKVVSESTIRSTEGSGEDGFLQLGSCYLTKVGPGYAQLELDPKYLDQKLQVGLVEKDGKRADPAEAFVAPQLSTRLEKLSRPAN